MELMMAAPVIKKAHEPRSCRLNFCEKRVRTCAKPDTSRSRVGHLQKDASRSANTAPDRQRELEKTHRLSEAAAKLAPGGREKDTKRQHTDAAL
jgi:hypothetical protein